MTDTEIKNITADIPKVRKRTWSAEFVKTFGGSTDLAYDDVDKLDISDFDSYDKFKKVIKDCRFYYARDPIASTVINKTVEIGVTDLIFEKNNLSENEFRIFLGIKDDLKKFMGMCALEYLISGLVIPEIKYAAITKESLNKLGVKKYTSLQLPKYMWLRDPATVKINFPMVLPEPSYFVKVPDKLVYFIMHNGQYEDGTKDPILFEQLQQYYPEFVAQVKAGVTDILLENDLIIRRKPITGATYPLPYLYSALESLKFKRNLRRMDYSLASRVITAIQLFKLGDKDFPVTEDDEDAFNDIREQIQYRNSRTDRDIERIFQLFANHTLSIEWIMPDVAALLDDKKYVDINADIFFSLGFPKILTTGETERAQTSNAEFATISPTKSMEDMQDILIKIVEDIVYQIYKLNGLKDVPKVRFDAINLNALADFYQVMQGLYDTGNISRETFTNKFGFDFFEEIEKREAENKIMKEKELGEFAPQPFSPNPNVPGEKPTERPVETGKNSQKPKTTPKKE